jgi:hypothetical protein
VRSHVSIPYGSSGGMVSRFMSYVMGSGNELFPLCAIASCYQGDPGVWISKIMHVLVKMVSLASCSAVQSVKLT